MPHNKECRLGNRMARFFSTYMKLKTMSDNKHNVGTQDDIRVDSQDVSEVEYLHRQFPDKTHEEIKEAIKKAGPLRVNIITYLQGKDSL